MRPLSGREREVADLLVEGDSNKVIAYKLGIHIRTVETYVRLLCAKLEVKNRVQAAVALVRESYARQ